MYNAGAHVSLSYRRRRLPEKSIKYWLLAGDQLSHRAGKSPGHYHTQPVEILPAQWCWRVRSSGFRVQMEMHRLNPDHRTLKPFKVRRILCCCSSAMGGQHVVQARRMGSNAANCGAPVFDQRTMETNVPGVYVAEDHRVGGTQDKYRLFIEGTAMCMSRQRWPS